MLQVNEEAILNSSLLNSALTSFIIAPGDRSHDASIQQAAILMTETRLFLFGDCRKRSGL